MVDESDFRIYRRALSTLREVERRGGTADEITAAIRLALEAATAAAKDSLTRVRQTLLPLLVQAFRHSALTDNAILQSLLEETERSTGMMARAEDCRRFAQAIALVRVEVFRFDAVAYDDLLTMVAPLTRSNLREVLQIMSEEVHVVGVGSERTVQRGPRPLGQPETRVELTVEHGQRPAPGLPDDCTVASDMESAQREFYEWLRGEIDKNAYPAVGSQWRYILILGQDAVNSFVTVGPDGRGPLREILTKLIANYGPLGYQTLITSLQRWLSDLDELKGDLESAWARRHHSYEGYLRLWTGQRRMSASDIQPWANASGSLTQYGHEYLDEVSVVLQGLLDEIHDREGASLAWSTYSRFLGVDLADSDVVDLARELEDTVPIDQLIECRGPIPEWRIRHHSGPVPAFASVPDHALAHPERRPSLPHLPVLVPPMAERVYDARCRLLWRAAENLFRTGAGLPRIGEGWVAETLLYQRVRAAFPGEVVVHQGRPDWLGQQSLDVFFPELMIGIEFQGVQHFEPVDVFGGEKGLVQTQLRDERKRRLCAEHGCILLEVLADDSPEKVIEKVGDLITARRGG